MTAETLLAQLHGRGITLQAQGQDLRVRAAVGVVTPELRAIIRSNKTALLDHLQGVGNDSRQDPEEQSLSRRVVSRAGGPQPSGVLAKSSPPVFAFDTETVDGEPITLQWAGPAGAELFRVSTETILPTFADLLRRHGDGRDLSVLWAHNLEFDLGVTFLAHHPEIWRSGRRGRPRVVSHGMILEPLIYGDRLLSATILIGGHHWWLLDTMNFFRMGLDVACERLRLPVRKQARPSFLGERAPTEAERPEFEAYALADAVATYHLGQFIVQAHGEFALPTTTSVAKMGGEVFQTRYRQAPIPTCRTDEGAEAIVTASRASYHGGKNGLYAAPGVYEDVAEVDIVSAYPHAMAVLPPLTHGRWVRVKEHRPDAAGIYRVRGQVIDRCPYGVFLHEDKDRPIKVHQGDFDSWVTGWELAAALPEVTAVIVEGYVWCPAPEATNPFRAYVEEFFRRKQETPRENPLRELYKLLLNALYGKLNQESGSFYNPFWASQITGHCRARLHALEHQYGALHSSTDSILTQATAIPSGSGLGDLEVRERGRLVLLRNKLYVILDADGRVRKATLHGFHGTAEDLLAFLRRGGGTYTARHMVKPREALVTKQRPFRMIEREYRLNIPPSTVEAIRATLAAKVQAVGE